MQKISTSVLNAQLAVPMRRPNIDIRQAVGYVSLELSGRERNLGTISILMVFVA